MLLGIAGFLLPRRSSKSTLRRYTSHKSIKTISHAYSWHGVLLEFDMCIAITHLSIRYENSLFSM